MLGSIFGIISKTIPQYFSTFFLNVQSGRVVRALELINQMSKVQGSNLLSGTSKSRSKDIVKLDTVQLYNFPRSNKAVGVLVL